MKKILFISNITNRITNFSLPSILASQSIDYEFHLAANLSNFKDNPSNYGIVTHHIDLVRNPFSMKNIKAYRQMIDLIKKEEFDAIHCNTPIGGVLGRLCGRKLKVPKVIYTAHGFHFYEGAPPVKSSLFKSVEFLLSKYTDAIITMNEEDRGAALNFQKNKNLNVYYVPGVGVDTSPHILEENEKRTLRESLGFKSDDIVLISMGDLITRKNYEASIKALSEVSAKNVHLLVCGKGPKLESLNKLVNELDLQNRVHFLGFRQDVRDLLSIADIFLFTTYQEGLPRSMMEAMAAGLPCIVSDVRGNRDLIEHGKGGYLYHPTDFRGFSKGIDILSKDENLRRDMKEQNLKIIKEYDVENVKRVMKDIYIKEL
ncbi:glycosyltransferase family 4 protein [Priestia megaterium]